HCTSTLFVSVSRLRPSLTLFPYTTLFRSVVGTDVLGDAARLASGDAGAADVVQQRGLAVVDVAHDGDHRRARDLLAAGFRDLREIGRHTSELQSRENLVCRLLLEKKNGRF